MTKNEISQRGKRFEACIINDNRKTKKWVRAYEISYNLNHINLPKNLKAFSITQPIVTHGTIK